MSEMIKQMEQKYSELRSQTDYGEWGRKNIIEMLGDFTNEYGIIETYKYASEKNLLDFLGTSIMLNPTKESLDLLDLKKDEKANNNHLIPIPESIFYLVDVYIKGKSEEEMRDILEKFFTDEMFGYLRDLENTLMHFKSEIAIKIYLELYYENLRKEINSGIKHGKYKTHDLYEVIDYLTTQNNYELALRAVNIGNIYMEDHYLKNLFNYIILKDYNSSCDKEFEKEGLGISDMFLEPLKFNIKKERENETFLNKTFRRKKPMSYTRLMYLWLDRVFSHDNRYMLEKTRTMLSSFLTKSDEKMLHYYSKSTTCDNCKDRLSCKKIPTPHQIEKMELKLKSCRAHRY